LIAISLEGGSKTQRDLTEKAVRYFVGELLPSKRSLNISVGIRNILKEGMAGCCEYIGGNEFEITLHHRGNLYEYISFLAHEMVHLKQYSTKELVTRFPKETWKGEDYSNVAYRKQPWEKEAWSRQHVLAKGFIRDKLGMTLVASKDTNPRSMKTMNWDSEMKYLDNIVRKEANGDYETAARQI